MAPTVARACDAPAMRWLAAVALAGCMSPVVHFGSGKSAEEAQHDALGELVPPQLSIEGTWHGTVKDAKIRVYADDEYRAQNLQWRTTFEDALLYANQVLASKFGVRIEAEYQVWNRSAGGAPLADSLAALEKQDPGTDVLTVVGLTSALSMVSSNVEQLGLASIGGRHLVIRGYADRHEREVFDHVFHDLPQEQRESLYQARRRHKTTTLLLHELGHNFGAPHQEVSSSLMNPMYSDHWAAFDNTSRETIRAGLDARLHRAGPAPPTVAAVSSGPATPAVQADVVVLVDRLNRWSVGGNVINSTTLEGMFELTFRDDPGAAVVIKLEPGASPGAAKIAADIAKKTGLTRVTITGP
jgi:hypothetical protein